MSSEPVSNYRPRSSQTASSSTATSTAAIGRSIGESRGEAFEGRAAGTAVAGVGDDLRRCLAQRCGQDRRRDGSDRSRLGSQVQGSRAGRLDRSKTARTSASAERYASGRAGRDHRERSDPSRSRRRSLADRRSLPMGMGRIPRRRRQADVEPRTARHGLPQAFGSSSPSSAGAGAIEDFKKVSPPAWRRSRAKKASSPTP
jgi:hypothetical protein